MIHNVDSRWELKLEEEEEKEREYVQLNIYSLSFSSGILSLSLVKIEEGRK